MIKLVSVAFLSIFLQSFINVFRSQSAGPISGRRLFPPSEHFLQTTTNSRVPRQRSGPSSTIVTFRTSLTKGRHSITRHLSYLYSE
jgi:hypothetical protein